MPKHLYTIEAGTTLPDPAGLPEGYPFAQDNGDGTHTLHALYGGAWQALGGSPGGGGGGGTPAGVGDFAFWKRTGVQDPTSNTFDYTADLAASSGTSITVDSSSAWITTWASAAPVLVAGVYSFTLSQTKSAAFWTDLQLLDDTGTGLTWTPSALSIGDILYMIAQDNGAGIFVALASITLYVPAGTHVDLGRAIGSDTGAQTNLLIQKVG